MRNLSPMLVTVSSVLLLSSQAFNPLLAAPDTSGPSHRRPDNIVELTQVIPGIVLDIRYATAHNFIGRPIPGYLAPKCLLTQEAAVALAQVQRRLLEQGYQLKIYDCYRPQHAVDAFVAWAEDLDDQRMKTEFYPNVDKQHLFRDGYIASKSSHSRGSTVDLTIVRKPAASQPPFDAEAQVSCEAAFGERFADNSVDMGTGFDCFSLLSHTLNPEITGEARDYRHLLKGLMEEAGFKNLAEEWWHFTLRDEPYPDTYFDFPIR